MDSFILALDQGTTSSRAIVFDAQLNIRGRGQYQFAQHFPADGQVEHDAEDIWTTTILSARDAMSAAGATAAQIAGIGITNQRETVVVWDRRTGKPIHRAIVWQDRRTAYACKQLKDQGYELGVTATTGLRLDPYFSATKLTWLLDEVPGARAAAEAGHLVFGTIDSWLLWRLTGGRRHATDATNASRTMLFDIHDGRWDDNLTRLFRVPRAMLPEVTDCSTDFGTSEPELLGGAIPILGMAGDQQAAAMGQACFAPGAIKATYGTGCFALLNTGATAVASRNGLLTTIAYQRGGQRTYALEGSIFIAGAAVQWLRDGLKIIPDAASTAALAARADPTQDVILVPAFVGLGAPHWSPEARGSLFGLTRATGPAELARATLQAVSCQTKDLLTAFAGDVSGDDAAATAYVLRVDGGMVASDWLMQDLADATGAEVDRPSIIETTALGAAWLAGRQAGVLPDEDGFAGMWRRDRRFSPRISPVERERRLTRWARAVRATIAMSEPPEPHREK